MPDQTTEVRDARPGQGHFVAPPDEVEVLATDRLDETTSPSSVWRDAWRQLRRNPIFVIATVLIAFVLVVVAWPSLFTDLDPRYCSGDFSMHGPASGHPFGFDKQGCDIFARTLYGARASVATGVGATLLFILIGGTLGALSGYYGGLLDSIVSRIAEIFYALPLMLAAIVVMQLLDSRTIFTVMLTLASFSWPQAARIARSAVIQAKNSEYVTAAKALGVSRFRTLIRHVLPNSAGPLIVVSTISLGAFIVTEATLSYLGVGLSRTIVSWGGDIAADQKEIRTSGILFYPATALALTVLSFILLGDAVRDALDPKARKR
ncbi:ABC transporter permease [Nocardia pseudobrasiliensis]|uniref:Oligopeptide transport system permease protein n=1 Tax=Nocardia pseudobrasiliensis TaxID=45979 RepID=A0A370I5L0_9NOCA|nr:ABC transporter permease [Nocardia pseudobrasiliensis]RDI66016.1 oligopeptide transport system permease protein [Nocardia pseudobrasiliensis]